MSKEKSDKIAKSEISVDELVNGNKEELFLDDVRLEAEKINAQVNELKKRYPEKSYREISDEILCEAMSKEFVSEEGVKIKIAPFELLQNNTELLQKATLDTQGKKTDIARQIIDFYDNDFQSMIGAAGNINKSVEIVREKEKSSEKYKALLNTNFEQLERNFLSLADKYSHALTEWGLVGDGFKSEDIYNLSPQELILVINAVFMGHLRYDQNIISEREISESSDILGLDKLLLSGNGVCRHYSMLFSLLFYVIKRNEKIKQKHLYEAVSVLDITDSPMRHAYNMVVKVKDNGDMVCSVLDPTFANGRYQQRKNKNDDLIELLDYSRSRLDRWNLGHESVFKDFAEPFLPPFLHFSKRQQETIEETDTTILFAKKYIKDFLQFSPDKVDSYEKFEDIIKTILVSPKYSSNAKKYFEALLLGAHLMASECYAGLPFNDREKIERLISELSRSNEMFNKEQKNEIIEKDRFVFYDYTAPLNLDQGYVFESHQGKIDVVSILESPSLRECIFSLLELLQFRVESLFRRIKSQKISPREIAEQLSSQGENMISPMAFLLSDDINLHLQISSSNNFDSSEEIMQSFFMAMDFQAGRPDPLFFKKILETKVILPNSKEDLPFFPLVVRKMREIIAYINGEIVAIFPEGANQGDRYLRSGGDFMKDEMEKISYLSEGGLNKSEHFSKILSVLDDGFSLEKFNQAESLADFVKTLKDSMQTLLPQLQGLLTGKPSAYGARNNHEVVGDFLILILRSFFREAEDPGEDYYYYEFDDFIKEGRSIIPGVVGRFFEDKESREDFIFRATETILEKWRKKQEISNMENFNQEQKDVLIELL